MDELTLLVKKNIKEKYSSTRKFSEELGIPQTTIVSAIKNGVGGTSFTTVCKMCAALDIRIMNGLYPVEASDTLKTIIEKMSKLDEKGLHTVATVLEMEYIRCKYELDNISFAEQNAIPKELKSYPILENSQVPTNSAINNLLKALNDDEDALLSL